MNFTVFFSIPLVWGPLGCCHSVHFGTVCLVSTAWALGLMLFLPWVPLGALGPLGSDV